MERESDKDLGIEIVLLERFTEQRLPRILKILEEVKEGRVLDDSELQFMEEVLENCRQLSGFVQEHPTYGEIYTRAIGLYHEVTTLALENERKFRHLNPI